MEGDDSAVPHVSKSTRIRTRAELRPAGDEPPAGGVEVSESGVKRRVRIQVLETSLTVSDAELSVRFPFRTPCSSIREEACCRLAGVGPAEVVEDDPQPMPRSSDGANFAVSLLTARLTEGVYRTAQGAIALDLE